MHRMLQWLALLFAVSQGFVAGGNEQEATDARRITVEAKSVTVPADCIAHAGPGRRRISRYPCRPASGSRSSGKHRLRTGQGDIFHAFAGREQRNPGELDGSRFAGG